MSYSKKDKYFPAGVPAAAGVGTLDISDASATIEFSWIPANDCIIYSFGGLCVEATGTQTTTVGVMSMNVATVEQSSVSAGVSKAVGTEVYDTTMTPIKVAAGTTVDFLVKTQAVGGTVTGDYAPFIFVEFFPALTGA